VLDHTIFTGVVRDDGEAPTRHQTVAQRGQGAFECAALVIHGDAQALKEAGKVGRAGSRPQRRANCIDEVIARRERLPQSAACHGPGKPASPRLIGEVTKDRGQGVLVGRIE
jgi:hypothetical protein